MIAFYTHIYYIIYNNTIQVFYEIPLISKKIPLPTTKAAESPAKAKHLGESLPQR